MQSIKLNPEEKTSPLSEVFAPSGIQYFSALMMAQETTPDGDWGATDMQAAARSGIPNSGASCLRNCYAPWLYSGCQSTEFNCRIAGNGPDPCGYDTNQFKALEQTALGRSVLQSMRLGGNCPSGTVWCNGVCCDLGKCNPEFGCLGSNKH